MASKYDYASGTCQECPRPTYDGSPICEACSAHEEANGIEYERDQLRAENDRLKKSALDEARAEMIEGARALEGVIFDLSKENERLKNLAELHRQAIEKDVSAHDRAEIQAFYDNIASKEPSLAQKANTVQVNAIARLNAEVEQLKARLEALKLATQPLMHAALSTQYAIEGAVAAISLKHARALAAGLHELDAALKQTEVKP